MLKQENLISPKRCEFLKKCFEQGISSHTKAEMVQCMAGKTDEEKENLAEQLLEIISTSSSEEEILTKAKKLK